MERRRVAAFVVAVVSLLWGSVVFGAPASPFPVVFTQPDGREITVYNRGDEFLRWVETPDGYTIVKNPETRFWEYAAASGDVLAPSGVVYGEAVPPPSGASPHMTPKKDPSPRYRDRDARGGWPQTPVSGTRKILVVLVGFRDRELTLEDSVWENMFFGKTGSVARYYSDQSYGKLKVLSALGGTKIVSVTLDADDANDGNHPEGFIDKGDNDTQHKNETAFLNSVIAKAAAKKVDFASFDANKDGRITPDELCVYLVVGGFETGKDLHPAVGAHAWSSWTGEGEEHIVRAGGKILTRWALNGELYTKDTAAPLGIPAHELGHQLCGLPDLYDTNYVNSGVGAFSLMAGGMYGSKSGENSGDTPVNLDAWSRHFLGWETPSTPTEGTVTFGVPLNGRNRIVKLMNPKHRATEYYLAEVRYPTGWDEGLAKFGKSFDSCGGILILRVDETIGSLSANDFNSYVKGKNQGLVPMEANGPHIVAKKTEKGTCETLWYNGNEDYVGDGIFSDAGTPSAKFSDGSESGISVSDISSSAKTMTATVSTLMPKPTDVPKPADDPDATANVSGGVATDAPVPVASQDLPPMGKPDPSGVGMDIASLYDVFGDDSESCFAILDIDNANTVRYDATGDRVTIGLESEFALENDVFYCWLLMAWNREENGWSAAWDVDDAVVSAKRARREGDTLLLESVFVDGGSFDMDGAVDGFVTVKSFEGLFGVPLLGEDPAPTQGDKGSGLGCSAGFSPLVALFLLPLFLLPLFVRRRT